MEKCTHAFMINKNDPVEGRKMIVWEKQGKIASAMASIRIETSSTSTETGFIEHSDSSSMVTTGRRAELVGDGAGWRVPGMV